MNDMMGKEFIRKALLKHGPKYDYSRVKYLKSNLKVKIKCFKHGIFEQVPNSHLRGRGCPECGKLNSNLSRYLTQEEFIERSINKHGKKYDYSEVIYKRDSEKVKIICFKHGPFFQRPCKHMRGRGCPRCARERKYYNQLTTEQFIEKARKVYGSKYDYSESVYVRSNIKLKIRCIKHNYIFESTPNNHLRGYGCYKCGLERIGDLKRKTPQQFIEKAKKIHKNKYDYSLVDYKKGGEKIQIICPKHGEFFQLPTVHLTGKGCPICGKWSLLTTKDFIKRARKIHGNLYGYSLVDYKNSRTPVKIKCSKHGVFEQVPSIHLHGCGCPVCLESRGEREIAKFLTDKGIKFKREKSFENCKYKNKLCFDFYLPLLNTCIEFDGIHHFRPVGYFGGKKIFDKTVECDRIKNEFCERGGIKLVRIPYTRFDKITSILNKVVKK